MKKILFTVALIATVTATILGILLHRTRSEQQRLERNQRALLGEVTLYKTRSEESAASVAVLELRIDELRRERKQRKAGALLLSGDNSLRDPPVPIPNTEVKPQHAESTWLETAR